MLNLFYKEPDNDRWVPYDRYPRRIFRKLIRGPQRPGGQMRVFLNLCKGLDQLAIKYRVNNFDHARRHPSELACIIGKPCVLDMMAWNNPILFGASIYSHPLDDLHLLTRLPIKKILVPGQWMADMCRPWWGDVVQAWPVGIDTDIWRPHLGSQRTFDVLLYDKVRWEHDSFEVALIQPIREQLTRKGLSFKEIRYGYYNEEDFSSLLAQCRAMVFLCEHETQGIAYQQALACGVPIFAWDRGGPWQDPTYFPGRVIYGPVSSVPYWDERCGDKFIDAGDFVNRLDLFFDAVDGGVYRPRDYIVENLTLEKCASRYLKLVEECM